MRRNTPTPKMNPPEPRYDHSEHRFTDPTNPDIDGVGRDEAEQLDSEPLCALQEMVVCQREGCDASVTTRYVYGVEAVSDDAIERIKSETEYPEYWYEWAIEEGIDGYRGDPTLEIEIDGDVIERIEPTCVFEDDCSGRCHGRPEPAVHADRHEL